MQQLQTRQEGPKVGANLKLYTRLLFIYKASLKSGSGARLPVVREVCVAEEQGRQRCGAVRHREDQGCHRGPLDQAQHLPRLRRHRVREGRRRLRRRATAAAHGAHPNAGKDLASHWRCASGHEAHDGRGEHAPLVVIHVKTEDQLADIFTKPLDEKRFCKLRCELNILESSNIQ